jgi:membrane protein implicated in regulation of membrane protease activity
MDAFFNWFTYFDHSHWFVFALFLLIAELATGTTYLLWPAVAAGIVGLMSLFFGTGILVELGVFAALTIVLTAVGRPLVRNRLLAAPGMPTLNERGAQMVGVRGVAAGSFVSGVGSVRINDTVWRAIADEPIAAGQAVEVLSVDGPTARVKSVG